MAVADSTTERLLQAVRAWLQLAAAKTPLTDAEVRVSADRPDQLRPGAAYLTVKPLALDVPVGTDETLHFLGDSVTVEDGEEGDVYALTVNGDDYEVTRGADDTNADIAAALAVLVNATDDLLAARTGDELAIGWAYGAPTTTGSANLTVSAGALPVSVQVGTRSSTFSIQGYGHATAAWLERAVGQLQSEPVQALLAARGVHLRPLGGMSNLAALLDSAFEARYGRDVELRYKRHEDPVIEVPAITAAVDLYAASDPGTLETTETVDLTD